MYTHVQLPNVFFNYHDKDQEEIHPHSHSFNQAQLSLFISKGFSVT